MRDSFAPGLSATRKITVDADRTIAFGGPEERFQVYATPELVRDVELTCKDLILEHADAGEDSVGISVNLDHMAATLTGMNVAITVTVREIEGRRVVFDIAAADNLEAVAKGSHARFVIDLAKTAERLRAKAAKLSGSQG